MNKKSWEFHLNNSKAQTKSNGKTKLKQLNWFRFSFDQNWKNYIITVNTKVREIDASITRKKYDYETVTPVEEWNRSARYVFWNDKLTGH